MSVVTNGLNVYYHYQQGYTPTKWSNIAPNKAGIADGTLTGTTLQANGVFFDKVDDAISVTLSGLASYTVEFVVIPPSQSPSFSSTLIEGTSYSGSDSYVIQYGSQSNNIVVNGSNSMDSWGGTSGNIGMVFNQVNVLTLLPSANASCFVYLNGVNKGSVASGSAPDTITKLLRMSGLTVIAVRVYNRSLTPAEISQNYAVGTAIGLGNDGTVGNTKFDSKQVIWQNNSLVYSTLQQVVNISSTLFDTYMALYQDYQKLFDTKQLIFSRDNRVYDLEQAIYKVSQSGADLNLMMYVDKCIAADLQQLLYQNYHIEFNTMQIISKPNNQIIGTVELKGNRQLNVYFVGERTLDIHFAGERTLNINLKGCD